MFKVDNLTKKRLKPLKRFKNSDQTSKITHNKRTDCIYIK